MILAATRGEAGPAIEFSTFEPSGAFVATVVLDAEALPVGTRIDPSNAAIYGTSRALYLSAALVNERSSAAANVAVPDSVLARHDATTGALEAWRGTAGDRARELRDPAGPDAPLAIVRDGAPEGIDPWLLAPATSPLVNADTWETHLLLARRWFEGRYLDEALDRIELVLPPDGPPNGPPLACDEGGSVERTGFGNRTSEFTSTYRDCRTAGALIDGTITERFGGTSDGRGRYDESIVTYENFRATLDDVRGTAIEIDATIERVSRGTTYPSFTSDDRWASTVERFVERSRRGTLTVSSATALREDRSEGGSGGAPPPAGGRGPTCASSGTVTTASASATVAPPHAPDATLAIAYENGGAVGAGGATLSVRASDGSSVITTGALDGSRVQRTSWGSAGARTELPTLRRLRPDLTILPER